MERSEFRPSFNGVIQLDFTLNQGTRNTFGNFSSCWNRRRFHTYHYSGLKMISDRNVLEITNERDGVFELNWETLEVKAIKGQAVIQSKR